MTFALAAFTFGLVAGLKPGPLGIFIIHQTLTKGKLQGFISSLAPILTDGPIILLAMLLTVQLSDMEWFISLISIVGGIYLAVLAYRIFNVPNSLNPTGKGIATSGLGTAVKINFLNPGPYIFWLTIGTGYIFMGSRTEAAIFVSVAIVSLCLTKFLVAVAIEVLGKKFSQRGYALLLKSMSLPMAAFSLQLIYSGLSVWT